MIHAEIDINQEAAWSLERLLPRLEEKLIAEIEADPQMWQVFQARLQENFPRLFRLYHHLYAKHYDFFYYLEMLLISMAKSAFDRPADLRDLDAERETNPQWFQSNQMVGGVCYVDLFAGNLTKMHEKIPYFKELGLTYLHLMPLFKMPEKENDTYL